MKVTSLIIKEALKAAVADFDHCTQLLFCFVTEAHPAVVMWRDAANPSSLVHRDGVKK